MEIAYEFIFVTTRLPVAMGMDTIKFSFFFSRGKSFGWVCVAVIHVLLGLKVISLL